MKKITLFLIFLTLIGSQCESVFSQITELSGQFRPRLEYRHGYGTLISDQIDPAIFVSQRTRINLLHANKNYRLGLSLQNVGVWGETGTLSKSDFNGTALHEAWAEVFLGNDVTVKVGRQEIVYDDHRIFGNVNWAQQGRSHDAAIVSFDLDQEGHLDFGLAYNARYESFFKENYLVNNYKTLQYIHWHGDFNSFGASVLVLNNGLPYWELNTNSVDEKLAFSQTFGTRLTYDEDNFGAHGAFYYQTGETAIDSTGDSRADMPFDLAAYYFSVDLSFKPEDRFSIGLGLEYLSGNEVNQVLTEDAAFKPLYGTNHKFNGWMDYFYVGNENLIGLIDIYVPLNYVDNDISLAMITHYFQSPVDLKAGTTEYDKGLGVEVDLMFGYTISETATIKVGYSHMFPTESMELLKGGSKEEVNNWAWVMLDLKPIFFKSEK